MMEVPYADILRLLLPETILVAAGLVALGLDLSLPARISPGLRRGCLPAMALLGCAVAALLVPGTPDAPQEAARWINPVGASVWVRLGLLVLGMAALALFWQAGLPRHAGEACFLLLAALAGLLLMASAQNLLLAFLALELSALCLYALVALDRRAAWSAEGALKYFLPGGVAAAFTLFGLSLLYGSGGSLAISDLSSLDGSPLVLAGAVFLAVGFGFKAALVPMHSWAPDVYQSAFAPVAGFVASASKLAGFHLFARIWLEGLDSPGGGTGWNEILVLLSALSLLAGNLAALAQARLRPLLAWSAIAHSGYIAFGVLAADPLGQAAMLYHLLTYGPAVLGLFALVHLVETERGSDHFSSLHRLHRRHPLEALCLAIFLLSLAGIPPMAGFLGKVGLFASLLRSPQAVHTALAVGGILLSTLSLYYYLRVLGHAYAEEGGEEPSSPAPLPLRILIRSLAATVLLFGCFPQILWYRLHAG